MSDWYQTFLVLFLVFPAMLLVGAFRFFYSKSRFVRVNNFFLLWPAIMICFWINIDILSELFSKTSSSEIKIQDIFIFNSSTFCLLVKAHIRSIGAILIFVIGHRTLEYINDWGGEIREKSKPNGCLLKLCPLKILKPLEKLLCFFHEIISHPWVGYIRT